MGPRCVLLTSLDVDMPAGEIGMLAAEGGRFWQVRTPLLPLSVNGAGDAIAALFLFHRLRSGDAGQALAAAASSIFGVLRRTAECGARELQVVAAQEEFVNPSQAFGSAPA
jgi:pyridoxine kinase